LISSYQPTLLVYAAAKLGIADQLASGPKGVAELAENLGVRADALERVLRALSALGVFSEGDGGVFAQSAESDRLRRDAEKSLYHWAIFAVECQLPAWQEILFTLKTGQPAFPKVFGKTLGGALQDTRAHSPEQRAAKRRQEILLAHDVMALCDFSRFRLVVDLGGGSGVLLAELLRRFPELRGITFDRAAPSAIARDTLAAAGVGDRGQVVVGDFIKDPLPQGGSAYVFKGVLFSQTDEETLLVLKKVREAIRGDGRLIILEQLIGPWADRPGATMLDVNWLVMLTDRERTVEEFAALCRAANFEVVRAESGVLEARPIC
jgi:hypothetical protein